MKELDDEFRAEILEMLFASAVRDGRVELSGDLGRDVHAYFTDFVRGLKNGDQLYASIDYAPGILDEARRYSSEGKHHYAIVFYAMWIEHWANGLITAGAKRFGGSSKLASQLMKKFSITEKLEVAWEIFEWGECGSALNLKALTQISDARNYLVHYKYGDFLIDDEPNEPFEKACQKAEIEIPRMIELENTLLFSGKRADISAHIRDGGSRRATESRGQEA